MWAIGCFTHTLKCDSCWSLMIIRWLLDDEEQWKHFSLSYRIICVFSRDHLLMFSFPIFLALSVRSTRWRLFQKLFVHTKFDIYVFIKLLTCLIHTTLSVLLLRHTSTTVRTNLPTIEMKLSDYLCLVWFYQHPIVIKLWIIIFPRKAPNTTNITDWS